MIRLKKKRQNNNTFIISCNKLKDNAISIFILFPHNNFSYICGSKIIKSSKKKGIMKETIQIQEICIFAGCMISQVTFAEVFLYTTSNYMI